MIAMSINETISFEVFLARAQWRIDTELLRAGVGPDNSLRPDAVSECQLALWRVYRRYGAERVAGLAARYLHRTIRNAVRNAFRTASHMTRARYADVVLLRRLEQQHGLEEALRELRTSHGWRDLRVRRALDAYEHRLVSLDAETDGMLLQVADSSPGPRDRVEYIERRRIGERALASLPEDLRSVVEGRLAGRNYTEIGRELGITKQAVQMRAVRGMKILSATLNRNLKQP